MKGDNLKMESFMNSLTYNIIVENGHIEIDNLPVPDNTEVQVTIKTKRKRTRREKSAEKIMAMLPKYDLGITDLCSLSREDIYGDDGR